MNQQKKEQNIKQKNLLDKKPFFKKKEQVFDTSEEKDNLKITFLGGIREIGRNCTAYEYNNKIYIIDCGTIFRSSLNLGINLALPCIDYLKANSHKIQSLLVTHGHQDHVGGIEYLIKEINKPIPIYAGNFPAEMLKKNLMDTKNPLFLETAKMIRRIKNQFSYFADEGLKFRFITVTHSTPDSYFIFIHTKTDNILHTGDWKFDLIPICEKTDFFHITHASTIQGVDLVVTDSTRCDQDGFSNSESDVIKKFDQLFKDNKDKRISMAVFASNASRVIKLVDMAISYGRKIFLAGWSTIKCINAAIKVNLIKKKDIFLNIESVNKFEPEETFIICTGAQGEEQAALSKMVKNQKKNVYMGEKDLVVFSANIIPGNEKNTMKLIEKMIEKKITVLHPALSPENGKFHVSGHGMRKDILMMLNLSKPKNFIPVHGELHHLLANTKIAEEYGISKEKIFLPDNGETYSLFKGKVTLINKLNFFEKCIDYYDKYIDKETIEKRALLGKQGMIVLLLKESNNNINLQDLTFYHTSIFFKEIKEKLSHSIIDLLKSFNKTSTEYIISNSVTEELRKYKRGLNGDPKELPLVIVKFI